MSRQFTRNFFFEVASGKVEEHKAVRQFGNAEDIQASSGLVDIWDGVENPNADEIYTYSTTADINTISSSSVSDTVNIQVIGLDGNLDEVTQIVTLNGQTQVTLTTALKRVQSMINMGSSDLVGEVYLYVSGTSTAGVPNTKADVRAIICIGNNRTAMIMLTIPNGKTGQLITLNSSITKTIGGSALMELSAFIRLEGGVFLFLGKAALNFNGNTDIIRNFKLPIVLPEKTDITFRASTDTNGTGIFTSIELVLTDD